MSRSTRSHPRRQYLVPGFVLIGLAASAANARAQSITPERALLNQIPTPTYRVVVAETHSPTPIDGTQALLSTSTVAAGSSLAIGSPGEGPAVDGTRALLGTLGPSSRRLMLAW